jgi:hypothetical protein
MGGMSSRLFERTLCVGYMLDNNTGKRGREICEMSHGSIWYKNKILQGAVQIQKLSCLYLVTFSVKAQVGRSGLCEAIVIGQNGRHDALII